MNDDIVRLHGVPCSDCGYPAQSHNVTTGQTYHELKSLRPCQTQLPRR